MFFVSVFTDTTLHRVDVINGAPHTVNLSCHVPDRTVNSVRDTVCFASLFADTTRHRVGVINGAPHTVNLSCHVPDCTVIVLITKCVLCRCTSHCVCCIVY